MEEVWVNKEKLSGVTASAWKKEISSCTGSFQLTKGNESDDIQSNQYWYDAKSGLWGWAGGPIQGE